MRITLFVISLFVSLSGNSPDCYGQDKVEPHTIKNNEEETAFIEAEKYYILGDYEKALVRFRKLAKLNPSNGMVHYKIAQTLSKRQRREDLAEASNHIEKALSLQKDNEEFYLLAAYIYSRSSNFSKAIKVLETMIEKIENMEKHLYLLGATYRQANKMDRAIKVYNQAEAIFGILEKSSLPKGKIYRQQGKMKEAVDELEKLTKAFPEEEHYTLELVNLLSKQGQLEEAISIANDFVETQIGTKKLKTLLVELYHRNNQEEKVREVIRNIFEDATISADDKIALLSIYIEEINRNNKTKPQDTISTHFAIELVGQLKKAYPDDPNVNIVGGDLFLVLNQQERARQEYKVAIRKGSILFEAWQNMLYLESQLDELDSLIVHSEKGLELFPNQAMFYYFNGYAHMRKGNYRKAARSLEQAKRRAHSQPRLVSDINQLLGDAYHELKEYERSDNAYDEALLLNPDNPLLLNNYSYYLALRGVNLGKAEKMASRAVKSDPKNNAYIDTYAWVLFAQGKYKKAKNVMLEVIKTDPSEPVFFDHYGDILFKAGDEEGAIKQWKKARQKGMQSALLEEKIVNKKLP